MKKLIFLLMITISVMATSQERIVSLAPGITEILFQIGAGNEIVGRTTACDYPEAAKKIEVAGDFVNPNIEKIISLKPTIVIGMDLNDIKMAKFGELGIKFINIKIKRVEDIGEAIKKIGKLTNHEIDGTKKGEEFLKRLSTLRKTEEKNRPKVFILIWDSPLITAGKTSIISDMVEKAGGVNIAGDINSDYPAYSIEQLTAKNPEFILMDPSSSLGKIKTNAKVIKDINPDIIFRPGPRLAEGIEKLHEIFDKSGKK